VDATARFVELVQRPESALPLDEAALLIAAHDHAVDVHEQLGALDALAEDIGATEPVVDAASIARGLFVARHFNGNTLDYGDPRNSYLDEVLHRRLGLPITLSVLMIEVGRRLDVPLAAVGMPGHFLVGCDDGFVDPFHQGEMFDAAGARGLFARTQPGVPFSDHYLEPVGPRAVLARMLANLVRTFASRSPLAAMWALELRLAIPGVAEPERRNDEATLRRVRARLN
jgi:regulator of sirC expression with transglutaminase-like and TPR domain